MFSIHTHFFHLLLFALWIANFWFLILISKCHSIWDFFCHLLLLSLVLGWGRGHSNWRVIRCWNWKYVVFWGKILSRSYQIHNSDIFINNTTYAEVVDFFYYGNVVIIQSYVIFFLLAFFGGLIIFSLWLSIIDNYKNDWCVFKSQS